MKNLLSFFNLGWNMSVFDAALKNNTSEIIEYLKMGNVNIVDDRNASLLHYAARGNAIDVANILIQNYIDINKVDINGESAIFEVVRTGKMGFIKLLLRFHADINIINRFGESLLFKAIIKNNQDVIDLLLENGNYNIYLENQNGENLLFYTLKTVNNQLFIHYAECYPKLLESIDYHHTNLLMKAIYYQNTEIVAYLLEKNFNLYALDNDGNNALFYAAKYANTEIVKLLLNKKPILLGKNNDGLTINDLIKEELNFIFDNYLNCSEYKYYLKTYPFHAAIVARNYDLLERVLPSIDIKKRDMYDISLLDYLQMVNDDELHKLFH